MDQAGFLKAIKELEAWCPTPWKKDADYLEERANRRAAIFEAVRDFPEDVVREPFQMLADEGQGFPGRPELVEPCRELEEQRRRPQHSKDCHRRFEPAAHECRPVQLLRSKLRHSKLLESGAWQILAWFQFYEIAHLGCSAEVKATCPKCGRLHGPVENPLIAESIEKFPEETTGWTPNVKGLLLCPDSGG